MNVLFTAAAVLLVAVTISGKPAGAQGVLEQLRAPRGGAGPEFPCKPFERTLEMRSAGPWSALDIVRDRPLVRPDNAETALRRLGGARVVLKVDVSELRKQMLMEAREDIMRIARSDRIGAPSSAIFRGNTIEFRPRPGVDMEAALKAFAPLISGPVPPLVLQGDDDDRAARRIVAFALSEQALEDRRKHSLRNSVERLGQRVNHFGIGESFIEALDDDRILVILPGYKSFQQFPQPMEMTARLEVRIADRFADPCAPGGRTPPDKEVLRVGRGEAALVLHKRVELHSQDLVEVAVVRDKNASTAIALRFNPQGQDRLARATQSNIGQALAVILDGEVIAAAPIRAPIVDGTVLFSGGLTMERARGLAMLMRAGWLPAQLTVVEQQIVEPSPQ